MDGDGWCSRGEGNFWICGGSTDTEPHADQQCYAYFRAHLLPLHVVHNDWEALIERASANAAATELDLERSLLGGLSWM